MKNFEEHIHPERFRETLAKIVQRRSSLNDAETTLIMSPDGSHMGLQDMEDTLETTLGQESVAKSRGPQYQHHESGVQYEDPDATFWHEPEEV